MYERERERDFDFFSFLECWKCEGKDGVYPWLLYQLLTTKYVVYMSEDRVLFFFSILSIT